MERKLRTIYAHSVWLESRKRSGSRGSVFLDFLFYRTYQALATTRLKWRLGANAYRGRHNQLLANYAKERAILGNRDLDLFQ
jgi:hypothetical protein